TKEAKDNVLQNIEHITEMFNIKQLGTEEDLAFMALATAGDERAVPILSKILLEYTEPVGERDPISLPAEVQARKDAAQYLGEIGDDSVIPALKQAALKDKNAEVRKSALFSLKSIAQQDSLETLKQALNDPDEKVRSTAKELIDSLKD
ncbi:HEAT repeat domain-containing protein, partial [bacterium]